MQKISSVIVTYHPNEENYRNISHISNNCDLVIVIDNTDSKSPIYMDNFTNCKVIRNNKNIGLSAAYNIGIETVRKYGYENIFLFDQDTKIPDDFFQRMLDFKAKYQKKYHEEGIIVPNFFDRNCKTFAKFSLIKPLKFCLKPCHKVGTSFLSHSLIAITSGTYLTYSIYKSIGPFREDYFIDFIDHEYCLRASLKGYKIIPNCSVTINHSIGKRSIFSLFGLIIKPNNHSPIRRYYFAKNSICTAIEYFISYPIYSLLVLLHIAHEFIAILFYENNKSKKIKLITLGIINGLFQKMNNINIITDDDKLKG